MYSMVVAQYYFKKDEDNKFAGFKGVSEIASEYTLKVYEKLNDLLRVCKVNKDLEEEDIFILNEVILNFKSVNEELNTQENVYLGLEEFLEKEELYTTLSNIEASFTSEVKPSDTSNEIKQIVNILVLSFRKDLIDYLNREKNLNISIEVQK